MNISELTHERLVIALKVYFWILKAINQDPHISSTIKSGFKIIHQCLHDHKSGIDLLESEVADKVSSSELHYALSQKLTVTEFLKYFQKVEKIVEGVENHAEKQEEQIEKVTSHSMSEN